MSVIIHGCAIAAAVALTMHHADGATISLEPRPIITYVAPPAKNIAPATAHSATPATPESTRQIQVPMVPLDRLPPITVAGPPVEDIRIVTGTQQPDAFIGGGTGSDRTHTAGPGSDGTYEVQFVERIPSVIGTPAAPRYPSALRANGVSGQVMAKFVVDTSGRAEIRGLEITESSNEQFSDAVREALARYRFAPGEVSGRKVRTMVLMPFTFSVH